MFKNADNNLNGFSLPIKVKDSREYRNILEEKLDEYINCIKRPAFRSEEGFYEEVKNNCTLILQALDELISKRIGEADDKVEKILNQFKESSFLVSKLNDLYSFRQVAAFAKLKNSDYDC